jgi:SAM-dependent methyltransferase
VLLVGSAACGLQLELTSLGYLLNGLDPRPVESRLATPSVIAARPNCLPFSDESIDAVVWLLAALRAEESDGVSWDGAVAEARRVLRPGGRFIVSFPFDSTPGLDAPDEDTPQFDTLFPAFRQMQTVFYSECAESRLLTACVVRSETQTIAAAGPLTALVVAEKH